MTTVPPDAAASPDHTAFAQQTAAIAPVRSAKAGLIRFAVGAVGAAFFLSLTFRATANVPAFVLHRQDRWLLLAAAILIALACYRVPQRAALPVAHARTWLLAALGLALVTYLGHYWVLCGYDLSRDEQMATFDATVFAQGHLIAHLPPLWRDTSDALNTMFMYPAQFRGGWISVYLPVNSAIRALFSLIGDPYLAGPAMTALGALALWGCVQKLWPGDREAGLVALLLYAGSGQVLFAGMTSYAMPGHLALDLCWLWLFLQRSRLADAAALVVGFLATGLHQPLMHPMFVAPFLCLLLVERRWDRAAIYGLGYAVIAVFWLKYPTAIWAMVRAAPDTLTYSGVDYMSRLVKVFNERDPMGLPNMVANMLRFIAWQHLLLVPLMVIGVRAWRENSMIAALAGGMVLTTLVMAVVLPSQGHGFGYRYLHGLLGNAILIAVYGWKTLDHELGEWRTILLRTTAAGLLVILPMQALMAHAHYAASATVSDRIDQVHADYVIVGRKDAPTAQDLALNPPDLHRHPIRLVRDEVNPQALCASHPVTALIGNRTLAPLAGFYAFGDPRADEFNADNAPRLAKAGCRVTVLP